MKVAPQLSIKPKSLSPWTWILRRPATLSVSLRNRCQPKIQPKIRQLRALCDWWPNFRMQYQKIQKRDSQKCLGPNRSYWRPDFLPILSDGSSWLTHCFTCQSGRKRVLLQRIFCSLTSQFCQPERVQNPKLTTRQHLWHLFTTFANHVEWSLNQLFRWLSIQNSHLFRKKCLCHFGQVSLL